MKSLLPAFLLILLCAMHLRGQEPSDATPATPVEPAPESTAPAKNVDDQIAAKEAEIARLKKQLQEANGEIQALHQQNKSLQTSDSTLKTQIVQSGMPLPRPAPAPLAGIPATSAPLASPDLFWYFKNSPEAANQYLKGRRFTVVGRLIGFDPPVMSHVFGLQLESGDPNLRVICQFSIPRAYAAVFFQRRTGKIIGKTSAGAEDTLLNINDNLTIEGQCRGEDDGDVLLANCRLIL
jgi:hypothetical protein